MKLYNGDCLEIIKELPDGSVDMVLTDPPYCVGATSNGAKGDFNTNRLIIPFFEILFSEYKRICKPAASLYINTDWRTFPLLYPIALKYFKIPNCIVWDYERIKAGNYYRFSHEFIMYCIMPNCKREFSASERDVWRIHTVNCTSPNKLHPAQKPVELCEKAILNGSKEGAVILDTFMGSGTTGVACVSTRRDFIGIEIDSGYFETAKKRIHNALITTDIVRGELK